MSKASSYGFPYIVTRYHSDGSIETFESPSLCEAFKELSIPNRYRNRCPDMIHEIRGNSGNYYCFTYSRDYTRKIWTHHIQAKQTDPTARTSSSYVPVYRPIYQLYVFNYDTGIESTFEDVSLTKLKHESGVNSPAVTTHNLDQDVIIYHKSRCKGSQVLHEPHYLIHLSIKNSIEDTPDPDIPETPLMDDALYNAKLHDFYKRLMGVDIDLQLALINTGRKPIEALDINPWYGNKYIKEESL